MDCYPLVNKRSYEKSSFLMGKSTIDGHFQKQTVKLPEGNGLLMDYRPIVN